MLSVIALLMALAFIGLLLRIGLPLPEFNAAIEPRRGPPPRTGPSQEFRHRFVTLGGLLAGLTLLALSQLQPARPPAAAMLGVQTAATPASLSLEDFHAFLQELPPTARDGWLDQRAWQQTLQDECVLRQVVEEPRLRARGPERVRLECDQGPWQVWVTYQGDDAARARQLPPGTRIRFRGAFQRLEGSQRQPRILVQVPPSAQPLHQQHVLARADQNR